MDELEELRAKRMRQLQQMQQAQGQVDPQLQEVQREKEMEAQIKKIVSQILSPEAQSRLTNIRLANPEFARQVEVLLIQLYQSGRLKKMSDEQLKLILSKIKQTKRESKIEFK